MNLFPQAAARLFRPDLLTSLVLGLAAFLPSGTAGEEEAVTEKGKEKPSFSGMSFLDNGKIRLGVDLDLGGAITFLADSKEGINVVNNHDWGRQIQMSFYSGPVPYTPGGKQPDSFWRKIGWNPIQSGDCRGNRSRVIAHENNGKRIVVKCIPMHWPLDNEPGRCVFESRIELEANRVCVRCRLVNNRRDRTQYPARGQEVPAVYTNGFLHRLMTYTGDKPFTGDALTRITKRWIPAGEPEPISPWDSWQAMENWAALVDDDGWGLGILTPETQTYSGGFFGHPGSGGSSDPQTGYIGPVQIEILDHNIQYEYGYTLILGTLKEIRAFACSRKAAATIPDFRFMEDRNHWHYVNCRDTGWPVEKGIHVLLEGEDPQIIGPTGFWHAADAPTLFIRAACRTSGSDAQIFWSKLGRRGFTEEDCVKFEITPDGVMRTYTVDLASSPRYDGMIAGLRFDPTTTGREGDFIKIESISFLR